MRVKIVELSDPAVMTAVHLTSGTVTNETLELTATDSYIYQDQDSIRGNTLAQPSDLRLDKGCKTLLSLSPSQVMLYSRAALYKKSVRSDRLPVAIKSGDR